MWLLEQDGPLRFADLHRELEPLGTNTLTLRLREMKKAGLITQRLYMRHPPRSEYSLTELGRSAGVLLRAVEDWSATYLPTNG